jgi:hypothetical protein
LLPRTTLTATFGGTACDNGASSRSVARGQGAAAVDGRQQQQCSDQYERASKSCHPHSLTLLSRAWKRDRRNETLCVCGLKQHVQYVKQRKKRKINRRIGYVGRFGEKFALIRT